LFDLPSYVEKKLSEAGIEKVENLKINTYSEEEKFFSFRRSFREFFYVIFFKSNFSIR
jgi:copper oxidase (laccase) domain-containing protein